MKKAAFLTVTVFVIFFIANNLYAQDATISHAQQDPRLGAKIFHTKTIKSDLLLTPPIEDGPVVVRASFHLQDINEIDESAETFAFTGILTLTWQDRRQAFNPKEAQTEEKIYQGSYQFNESSLAWYPQVILSNESGLYDKHSVLLRVKPDGTSTLVETVNAIAEVDMNLRRCPFDRQRLMAKFEVLGFDMSEVVLEAVSLPPLTDSQKIKIPQWVLTNVNSSVYTRTLPHAGSQGASSLFVFTIDVKRKPFYLLRLVVLPLLFIVMLSWTVFWMDRSSLGDRINVSFIGILTAVAFQMVVSEHLPQISYVTLIHGFLNMSFIFMCLTAIINLIVGWLDKQGKFVKGNLIDYRCRMIIPIVYFSVLLVMVIIVFFFF
jgi:hypothetical protein